MIAPDTSNLTTSAELALRETEAVIALYESQLQQLRSFRTACQQVIQNARRIEGEGGEVVKPETWAETLSRLPQNDSEAA